jgi:prepilin-type N-terminal cleavage/methylation domain-containing protein
MRRQRRRGYTLMEIVLTMAIMVMLAALGYPTIDSLYTNVKVEAASDAVRAAWAEAQAHAVNEGRAYRFAVVPGKGNFRIAPDSSDFWTGSTPSQNDPDNPFVVDCKALPTGIVFTMDGSSPPPVGSSDTALPEDGVDPGQWHTAAVFLPDGTAQEDADITFQLDGTRPITIHLRALTGVVTVQRGE